LYCPAKSVNFLSKTYKKNADIWVKTSQKLGGDG
jgi:hypothetical protein